MLENFNNTIYKWLERAIILVVIIEISILFIQIILRYLFGISYAEISQAGKYLFVWITFIGVAIGFRKSEHLGAVFLREAISREKERILLSIIDLILILFWLMVIFYGYKITIFSWRQSTPSLKISFGYVYMSIVVGGILSVLFIIENLIKHIFKRGGEG